QNNPQSMQTGGNRFSVPISLTAGFHTITIGYYEGGGGHGMNVSYNGPDTVGKSGVVTGTGGPFGDGNVGGWIYIPQSVLYSGNPLYNNPLNVTAESTINV